MERAGPQLVPLGAWYGGVGGGGMGRPPWYPNGTNTSGEGREDPQRGEAQAPQLCPPGLLGPPLSSWASTWYFIRGKVQLLNIFENHPDLVLGSNCLSFPNRYVEVLTWGGGWFRDVPLFGNKAVADVMN